MKQSIGRGLLIFSINTGTHIFADICGKDEERIRIIKRLSDMLFSKLD